jgi:DNA-directed RNA polymerase
MLHGRGSLQSMTFLKEMQRWFEVEILSKGVPTEANLLVTMLRACIRALEGSRRDRSIRRYAEIARKLGETMMDDVLLSEDYDDNEFAILGRATAEYYKEPSSVLEYVDEIEELSKEEELSREEELSKEPELPIAAESSVTWTDKAPPTLPEVRATLQKGRGLDDMKQSLRALATAPDLAPDADAEAVKQAALARERKLEIDSAAVAVERWREADQELRKRGINSAMQNKSLAALMYQWYEKLVPALQQELESALADYEKGYGEGHAYAPYFSLMPIEKLAANTILFVTSQMTGAKNQDTDEYESGALLVVVTRKLSQEIESGCLASYSASKVSTSMQKNLTTPQLRKLAVSALEKLAHRAGASDNTAQARAHEKKLAAMKLATQAWPATIHVKLGAVLISKLVETAQLPVTKEHPVTKQKITQLQPAFLHRYRWSYGKKIGYLLPNPALTARLQHEPAACVLAKRMPMVVEPKPWAGWNEGAYLHYPSNILRITADDGSAKVYFQAAHERGQLDQVYQGLNALGKVGWKVFEEVYKVQLEAWNTGEAIANFAPAHLELPSSPEPDPSAGDAKRRQWYQRMREANNQKQGAHSKRCFQNFQMEAARSYLGTTMYLPHNLDFRGRAYPIPPYLNHMGADNVRALLVFAEGRELGEAGLRWLKIHMATVAGFDKASMEERVQFTMSHLDDIYDSVRNPLTGRRWWLQTEDAWQTLAACFELTAALDSPDPTKFVSHLPIQQDGSCNGLQHYAALGGDRAGAAQVNLEPSDRPADVYGAVLDSVKKAVDRDAKNGVLAAQILQGRLTRKCVKQPVMTNVYGVTFFGARAQVRKQLATVFPELQDATGPGSLHFLAHYVAKEIFQSLGEMFRGAQAIQTWLGQCADRISRALTPEQIEELKNETKPVNSDRTKKAAAKTTKKAAAKATKKAAAKADAPVKKSKTPKKVVASTETTDLKPMFRTTVVWTTPLGLPVVQPYRMSKAKSILTRMQLLAVHDPQAWDPVSRRKQLQAFPPNFIHSLDATHMLLSAQKCSQLGLTFASIHDSFWTHAADVDRMNEVLREAFVAMHSEDIVGRLLEEFQVRYKGYMYMTKVLRCSPLGQKIAELRRSIRAEAIASEAKDMPSMFSLEVERMRLLQSDDPEERARGAAMVTAGSLLLAEREAVGGDDEALMKAGLSEGEVEHNPVKEHELKGGEGDGDGDVDLNVDVDGHGDDAEDLAVMADADAEAKSAAAADASKKPPVPSHCLFVWLPLTFPPVPAKGDFDVARLRQSRYFFH